MLFYCYIYHIQVILAFTSIWTVTVGALELAKEIDTTQPLCAVYRRTSNFWNPSIRLFNDKGTVLLTYARFIAHLFMRLIDMTSLLTFLDHPVCDILSLTDWVNGRRDWRSRQRCGLSASNPGSFSLTARLTCSSEKSMGVGRYAPQCSESASVYVHDATVCNFLAH